MTFVEPVYGGRTLGDVLPAVARAIGVDAGARGWTDNRSGCSVEARRGRRVGSTADRDERGAGPVVRVLDGLQDIEDRRHAGITLGELVGVGLDALGHSGSPTSR